MKMLFAGVLLGGLAFAGAASAQGAEAEDTWDLRYLQVMLGTLDAGDAWTIRDDSGEISSSDWSDLIYGGVAVQLGSSTGKFQYGLETGGMISFKNDTNVFGRSEEDEGLNAQIEVENDFLLLDVAAGGFVSYRPWRAFRVYASAGPALMLGTLFIEDEDVEIRRGEDGDIDFRPGDRETDVDAGLYARVGFDIILDNGFVFGASARKVDGELDFGNSGTVELDDVQYFLSLGWSY